MHKLKTLATLVFCLAACQLSAQKKYNGLLWEISGKGLKKPSYLYGTMHVSNKLVFRLGEPFYKAISECDVVATELNPDTWFEDFVNSEEYSMSTGFNDYDYSRSKKKNPYQLQNDRLDLLKNSFAYDPSIINNLMYRYSRNMEDFEEATFLDLYIYKCGKKMGKKIAGVETLDALNTAMEKATHASANDREEETPLNPKDRLSAYSSREKMEDAYRQADLDMIDSLGRIGRSRSEAEYILYNRNKIMGAFIDSVVKKQRLFIGVGAAHLPGPRGVIEWLRAKGYTVRPVDMGERDAERRAQLDSIIYEQKMNTYVSGDSFYSVSAPGHLHDMLLSSEESAQIGMDAVNGAYYSVNRIMSASFLGNESDDHVYRTIDSMLYESVPGDILENKKIEKSGYKGFDIINKTRRGDLQRYQIFVTPDEVIVFKLSGTGNFVYSDQARRFFESIKLKPNDSRPWKTYHSPDKTFSIYAPANAHAYFSADINSTDNKFLMLGSDRQNGNRYFVFKHNYYMNDYIEEDSIELADMDDGFSEQARDTAYSRRMTTCMGRPALRVRYMTPDHRHIETMMLLNQRYYYIVGVYYGADSSANSSFLDSFRITNIRYDSFYTYTDTNLRCTVKLPYKPKGSQGSGSSYNGYSYRSYEHSDRSRNFYMPGCDEIISVSYYTYGKYSRMEDTTYLNRVRKTLSLNFFQTLNNEKITKNKDGWTMDVLVTDTASTMQIRKRWILKNGTRYQINAYVDPVLGESDFSKTFFATFSPQDTVIGQLPWIPKGGLYLKDLFSKDSLTQDIAMSSIGSSNIEFDDQDLHELIKAVKNPPATTKKNIDLKRDLYASFGHIKDPKAIDFLKSEYARYDDSVEYESAILYSLVRMRTPASIAAFKELLLADQPVGSPTYKMDWIFYPLIDSPSLATGLFPDLYALLAIDDYKEPIYKLLATLVERGLMTPGQYRDKELSILTDAKLTFKRERSKSSSKYSFSGNDEDSRHKDILQYYNSLLVPYADSPSVRSYLNKVLLQSKPDLRAATAALMYKKRKPLPDTIWASIASEKKGIAALYDELKGDTLLNLFPARFRDPEKFAEEMANNYLKSHYSYNETIENKDSVLLIYQAKVHFDKDSGTAYYFKLKSGKDKFWKTRIVGLEPLAKDTFKTYNDLYTKEEYYLDETKNVREQFEAALREILKDKLRNKNPYYTYSYDYTKRTYN